MSGCCFQRLLRRRVKVKKKGYILYDKEPENFSYYEYKYRVQHRNLKQVLSLLECFLGKLDPFSTGIVDSIYYDTIDRKMYGECVDGDAKKSKFRIRGYGDGTYNQVHQKFKNLYAVSKYKSKIVPIGLKDQVAPAWSDISAIDKECLNFSAIQINSTGYGHLVPVIRVKYKRYRYRVYDYRITLDTDIEVSELSSFLNRSQITSRSYVFPFHVLEVKTRSDRPNLPFMGVISLPQISCSKFMLGLNYLTGQE